MYEKKCHYFSDDGQGIGRLRGSNVKLAKTVFLFQFSQVEVRRCKYNEYTIESKSGNLTCLACRSCPPGFDLFPQCGKQIKDNGPRNECKPCQLGKTYSAHDGIDSCEPCGSCADHQTILKNCTLVSDSQCNDTCSKGFYFEDLTGDCHPCSWCCSDASNKVRSGCKDMPFYKQCDVNTAKDCKPKCQNDQYVVPGSKGGGYCKDCKVCPPGTSPFPECGSVVENINNISCKDCIEGRTYSDSYGKHSCKPCTRCSIGQREVSACNLANDTVCRYRNKGFCRDDNRKEPVVPHSNFMDWFPIVLVAGIIVVVGLAVLSLWWKCCRKVTKVHRLDGSNLSLIISHEEPGRNCPSTY